MDRTDGLLEISRKLRQFAQERHWEQFHTPKNLASALVVEAAELLEPFQWLITGDKAELGDSQYEAVRHEMADVLAYLIMLADRLEIDLIEAAREKIALNAIKYPVEMVRGKSEKYSSYRDSVIASEKTETKAGD
jgi:dCTP diphosphatase